MLVFVALFLMTRAGEYNDELILDNQILHVGCSADESNEDAMLCFRFETIMSRLEPRG